MSKPNGVCRDYGVVPVGSKWDRNDEALVNTPRA